MTNAALYEVIVCSFAYRLVSSPTGTVISVGGTPTDKERWRKTLQELTPEQAGMSPEPLGLTQEQVGMTQEPLGLTQEHVGISQEPPELNQDSSLLIPTACFLLKR